MAEGRCGGKSKEEVAFELFSEFMDNNAKKKKEAFENIDAYLSLYAKILLAVQVPSRAVKAEDNQ